MPLCPAKKFSYPPVLSSACRFYIDNWQTAVGKDRIDWQVDPPPDLVIDMDVTTYTAADDYAPYHVPEVWLFKQKGLKLYTLVGESYQEVTRSRYFLEVDLVELAAEVMRSVAEQGKGAALRQLRNYSHKKIRSHPT